MRVSGRAIVISAVVFFSAIGIYVSSSSPSETVVSSSLSSETVVSDSLSTTFAKRCFEEYCIGDTGPGGGTIVYVNESGLEKFSTFDQSIGLGCQKTTCHVLEMAPADLVGQYSWRSAVAAAEAFSTPSRDDWVLPSANDLNVMCKYAIGEPAGVGEDYTLCKNNKNGTDATGLRFGGFSTDGFYWSSSEFDDGTAFVYGFWSDYVQGANKKYRLGYVRPVRAF
jgi:hypothetical protein